ncbi:TIGR04282 family arsenosugar biosynthesis glycosyltransferase [Cyanobium sp. L1E-Cus]|uniref:TIGR04282 family arsenosugar biosynthesis glycosyltransferase n=1 Tax=Cyanobium sp. L1E-Cus TaxID=2823714 RepID=UPI0020CF9853|nr:TIGR04282 family arsenosugar biosynthesis glycosyltransferase [Cyanobium sp. L1E-Cus]
MSATCSRQLIVMARWPAPGRCKRRLAQELGAARAAQIQARLTVHTLAAARDARQGYGLELVLAVEGLGGLAASRWGQALGADRTVLQGRGALGLRMQRQFQRAAREGASKVVLIGSDLPELEASDLSAAFTSLGHCQGVLGPALDGGYWLIGLRRPEPELLAGIAWGGAQVLEQTLAAMARRGLEPELLTRRGDLDWARDLLPWR